MDRIFDTVQRIEQLWKDLERMKPKTLEYEELMERIRVLSAEYLALIDAPKKPRELK
jgi:hypothetical protein